MKSLSVFLALAFIIAGCSQHAGNDKSERIAAVVNGAEITKREVDFLYQRAANPKADSTTATNQRRSILAGLVRSELLAQQATKMKIDQSPEFILGLHDARRRLLAELAEEKIASTAKPVSQETVQQIISDNPNLFADRKLLVYEEIFVACVDVPFLQSLNSSARKGVSLTELLEAVKRKAVPFQRGTKTLTTDQIDQNLLKVLITLKPYQPVVVQVEDKFSMILMLYTAVPIPLEGKTAELAASNLANTRQRSIAISETMGGVLDHSTITYASEFKTKTTANSEKEQAVAMPVPDAVRAHNKLNQQIKLTALLTLSFTSAMLLFFGSKSILLGKLWLPRLWPAPKENALSGAIPYDYDVYEVSPAVKLTLFFLGVSTVVVVAWHLFLVWDAIPFWMMVCSLGTGILMATVASHLFNLHALNKWTTKIPWFHWMQVVFFVIILGTSVFVTIQILI
ncbi:MAG: peptidyl-prolyl cis-trans isomerase, EpsD family [Chlorobium sp.]|nr:MAG: peptidyl-prolyl cis-trans isomerase, EpsD family [Chlorobium sp.]